MVGGGYHLHIQLLRRHQKVLVAIAGGRQQQQDAWHRQNDCSC